MATVTTFYNVGPFAAFCFLIVPAVSWAVTLSIAHVAMRRLASRPMAEPPARPARILWRFFALVTLDPVIFGFVLWILAAPLVTSLQAGGSAAPMDYAFLLFSSGGALFVTMCITANLSQVVVFRRRIQDLLGPFSTRVLLLLALPIVGAVGALVAALLIFGFAEAGLANAFFVIGDGVSWTAAAAMYIACAPGVLVAFAYAASQDPGDPVGVRRARLAALLGTGLPLALTALFAALALRT